MEVGWVGEHGGRKMETTLFEQQKNKKKYTRIPASHYLNE